MKSEAAFNPKDIGTIKPPARIDQEDAWLLEDVDQRWFSEMEKLFHKEAGLLGRVSKLAADRPELRSKLVPFIKMAGMTVPERFASLKKLAHKPILEKTGLTPRAVSQGLAFMVYNIDQGSNKSKFYEGLILESGGGFRLIRRWGALTDSAATGRVDGAQFDEDPRFLFSSLGTAKRELAAHFAKRVSHGYVDAFGPETPVKGQYPIGLSRDVGFGWNTQSITRCIPQLKILMNYFRAAHDEVRETGKSDLIQGILAKAVRTVKEVAHADSSMAQLLIKMMKKPLQRVKGDKRFIPDFEGRALAMELEAIISYLDKQMSLCRD
jgi:hypothetical protein